MTEREQVIKHMEMIQGIVNRLAFNSFLIKGWSITILAAALLFIANVEAPAGIVLCFAIPVLVFWGLDGYFLWQERLFRKLYNRVRELPKTDFAMALDKSGFKDWCSTVFSRTLIAFYAMELAFVLATFGVLLANS